MTLMPVSKISVVGDRSPNWGGSRWIPQRSVPSGAGGLLSTGSPRTFQTRPSVVSPTGSERLASCSSAATRAAWSMLQQYELTSEGITLLRLLNDRFVTAAGRAATGRRRARAASTARFAAHAAHGDRRPR